MSSRRSSLIDPYNHPSFSSSLLEEIYRSFDEDQPDHSINDNNNNYRKFRMNHHHKSCNYMEREKHHDNDDRFGVNRFVLDQWMRNNDKSNSMSSSSLSAINSVAKFNSSSSTSSSDSSSGIGGFSSSDTESVYKSKTKPKILTLKPIKTNVNPPEFHRKCYSDEIPAKKKEGNLQKRALKLYGDLKKVKQPISPGGKLASFLNSLFNSNASKKPKISTSTSSNGLKYSTSTPSTASSYSRSCLSKTPSSAGRFERRSVRFCPVNTVIAVANYDDNDKKVREGWRDNNTISSSRGDHEELKVQIMEKHRRVEEVAKELLKSYHNGRKSYQNDVSSNNKNNIRRYKQQDDDEDEDEDEDDDDDDASCCSSDLFELEIGVDRRYREELPVYETTHVHTNRAIANGFIL